MYESGVTDFANAIRPEILTGPDAYREITLTDFDPADLGVDDVKVYFQRNKESAPRWLSFFGTFVEFEDIADILNSSNSLIVLLMKTLVDGVRIFAIPAGMGFHGLKRENLEPGFGCRVSLNTIRPDQVKAADARTLEPNPRLKRSMMGQYGTIYELDIDPEEELSFIAGKPREITFARKVSGADSLKISREITATGLGNFMIEIHNSYNSDDYKANFPTVNSFPLVTEQDLIDKLDEDLFAALLNDDEADRVVLVHPEINTWEDTSYYELSFNDETLEVESLESEDIRQFVIDNAADQATFRMIKIGGFDDTGAATIQKRELYNYCVFETKRDDLTYHLANSTWHEVPKEFIERIDRQVTMITSEDSITFPDWTKTLNENTGKMSHLEGNYNVSTSAQFDALPGRKFLCLDAKTVTIPGGTAIEACDIISDDGLLIHVKKSSGSSTLGHLWNQGLVSSELLARSPEFRQKLIDKIREESGDLAWPVPFTATNILANNFTVVYGIGVKQTAAGDWTKALPLFSKVSLLNVYKKLTALNFQVKINRVEMI
jgi:uncharacterized protein (TIGR04141 family)